MQACTGMMENSTPNFSELAGQFRLLIFELDGMLQEGRALRARSLADALSELVETLELDVALPQPAALQLLSENIEANMDLLAPGLNPENLVRLLELVEESKLRQVEQGACGLHPEFPGALAKLRDLGCRVAVLSLSGRAFMLGVIDYFELHRYIDISVCPGDVGNPDPSVSLLEILEKQQSLRSEAVFISNRGQGLAAARGLGVSSVGCRWGGASTSELGAANEVVATPVELVKLLFPSK